MTNKFNIKRATVTQTTHRHELRLSRNDLVALLRDAGMWAFPDDANVYVQVPGGGDWSNTALDIDDEHPIVVRWKEETTQRIGDEDL